ESSRGVDRDFLIRIPLKVGAARGGSDSSATGQERRTGERSQIPRAIIYQRDNSVLVGGGDVGINVNQVLLRGSAESEDQQRRRHQQGREHKSPARIGD